MIKQRNKEDMWIEKKNEEMKEKVTRDETDVKSKKMKKNLPKKYQKENTQLNKKKIIIKHY